MKTPDKIYIPFYPNDDGIDTHLGDDWFDSKDVDQYVGGWKEYIRKDALIEWATNLKERWKEPPVSVHSPGCVYMLEQVINKINSL